MNIVGLVVTVVIVWLLGRGTAEALAPAVFVKVAGLTLAATVAAFGVKRPLDALVALFAPAEKLGRGVLEGARRAFSGMAQLAAAAGVVVALLALARGGEQAAALGALAYGAILGGVIFLPLALLLAARSAEHFGGRRFEQDGRRDERRDQQQRPQGQQPQRQLQPQPQQNRQQNQNQQSNQNQPREGGGRRNRNRRNRDRNRENREQHDGRDERQSGGSDAAALAAAAAAMAAPAVAAAAPVSTPAPASFSPAPSALAAKTAAGSDATPLAD